MTTWSKGERHGRIVYEREGMVARDQKSANAYRVEIHHNYNGSGDDAFGGADKWPVVSAHVAFLEGQEDKAALFAEDIKAVIDTAFAE